MRAPEPAGQAPGPAEPAGMAGMAGFEHRLRAEFDAAAAGIMPPAPTGAAVITRRRHQRRAVTAVIAVAAAVALVTGGVTVLTGATRHAAPATVPAHTQPETRVRLYGVTFGWLPPGVARYDDTVTVLGPTSNQAGASVRTGPTIQQELGLAPVAEVDQALAGGDPPSPATTYTVAVLRVQPDPATGTSPEPGIELSRQWDRFEMFSRDWTATEVYSPGIPARSTVLIRRNARPSGPSSSPSGDIPPVSYALYVHVPGAPAGVIVTGPDPDTIGRIGVAATVDPQPAVAPAQRASALAGIRQAARAAFDGPTGAAMLTALTAPDQARPALTEALSKRGPRIHDLRLVGLGEVGDDRLGDDRPDPQFLSPTEAEVTARIDLLTADGQRHAAIPVDLRLVLTGGRWKVTTASYCAALTPVLRCPTIP
ncbi:MULTISPECIES: hypothetical protein [Pseudofrankia]|uniref:hypothetical protein n=1 Tax=Pseudofrankia TaxID=2994363 RepID=UPI000234D70A|nr:MULTISPECIES: hypothetical protein [Pseudofrankia]OHV36962.1 hypothetical protein BCD49_16990 [Pseudofrankia sp. EUN1h]